MMSEGPKAGFSFDFRIKREETRPRTRACDHAGCMAEGTHRAPKSRAEPNTFYWFCQDPQPRLAHLLQRLEQLL
ncbi:MAG TPA: hypothetical protein PLA85_10020, partial [Micropepsaceae bacterium]|nr:hypothetical protein [Micropepsaceae bacterium]